MFLANFDVKIVWVKIGKESLPSGYPDSVEIAPSYIDVQFPAINRRFQALSQGIAWKTKDQFALPAIHRLSRNGTLKHPLRTPDEFTTHSDAPTSAAVVKGNKTYPLKVVKRIAGSGQIVMRGDRRCEVSPDLQDKTVFVRTPAIVERALITQNDTTVKNVVLMLGGILGERPGIATVPVSVSKRSDLRPPNSLIYPDRITLRFPYRETTIKFDPIRDSNFLEKIAASVPSKN